MFKVRFNNFRTWMREALVSIVQPRDGARSRNSDEGNHSQETYEIKKLAHDLLASLAGRRMEPSKIKFTESGRHDSGGKGDVVLATIVMKGSRAAHPEGRRVAVKKLKFSRETDKKKLLKAFVNEARIVDMLSHPHIVEITGFVEDIENGILWMVFPWEANGNVREFLRSGEWEIPERVSLIQDVAEGLEYLHNRQPPIRHGDLKSLNILVNDSCRAVITDFGSARGMSGEAEARSDQEEAPTTRIDPQSDQSEQIELSISNNQLTLTGPSWSFRWAAPEILNGQEPDLASDVWALGWICWEIMTDNYPFPETNAEGLITVMVTQGQLPSVDAHDQLSQIRSLFAIMLKCWKPDPKKRPSATECRKSLGFISSSIPVVQVSGESRIRSAGLLLELGSMHRLHDRNDEAVKVLERGLIIAQLTGDKQLLAKIIVTLGHVHQDQGEYAEAEKSYTQGLEIYTSIRNDWGRAAALRGLGLAQNGQSKYAEAEESFTQALEIFTSIGNNLGQANALDGLGDVQRMQSKYAEAEGSYTQALKIYTSVGFDLGRANALKGLGNVQLGRSKYAEAEESYTQALEIYTSIGDDLGRADALHWLGTIQLKRLKYAEAEEYYTQALETSKRIGNPKVQTNSTLGLGEVRLRQARYAEARALISDGAEIAERIDYPWGKYYSKKLLADLLAAETSSTEPQPSTSIPAPAATEDSTASASPL